MNPFFTFVHSVAYRTNLAALGASKFPSYKAMSKVVDTLLNSMVAYFKTSYKQKIALQVLQIELSDAKKNIERYHKIQWLYRCKV